MKLNGVRKRLPFEYNMDFRDIVDSVYTSEPDDGWKHVITMKNGDVLEWSNEWGLDGQAYSHFCMWLISCYHREEMEKKL
jgi:hypothetical protein